jgi:hypothetical protein
MPNPSDPFSLEAPPLRPDLPPGWRRIGFGFDACTRIRIRAARRRAEAAGTKVLATRDRSSPAGRRVQLLARFRMRKQDVEHLARLGQRVHIDLAAALLNRKLILDKQPQRDGPVELDLLVDRGRIQINAHQLCKLGMQPT